jgi:hypothetical protein
MVRTMVYLDETTKQRLKAHAKRLGVTEAQVIREALTRHLDETRPAMPRAVGRCTDGGVARHIDDALDELGFGRGDAG